MQEDVSRTTPPAPYGHSEQARSERHIGPDHQLPPPDSAKPHRSGWTRAIVWLLLLLAFAGLFYFVFTRKSDTAAAPAGGRRGMGGPVTATVVTAQRGDIGVYLSAIGTVTPVYTDSLTSQVTGLITQVNYKEGQVVRKGQTLIQIDPRPYQANLLTAEGALERDQNLLAEAQMDLKRYQDAWAKNAIQRQTLEDQEKLVLQDEGTVKNDEGTVAYDKVQVGFCDIFSPISGRVGLRLVDPGNVVTSGSTTVLAVVTQLQPITIIFTIPEDSLGEVEAELKHGAKLQVEAYDRSDQTRLATGTLSSVDNQIDTATGTLKMRATFANTQNTLFPNEFVNTKLLVRTLRNATLIPLSAVQHNGNQAYVYVVDPESKTAKQTNVKTGVADGLTTSVTGVNPGDVLANSSFEKIQNGSKINISTKPLPGTTTESNAP
jgi:multidrug efflux system membrane fusion protein